MIWDDLELVLLGFAVVMTVLLALWAITAGVGRIFIGHARAAQARKEKAAQAAQVPPTQGAAAPGSVAGVAAVSGVPPHHLAAIAAAVAAVMPGRHRVVQVDVPAHHMPAWLNEGRFEHMSSHGGRASAGWVQSGPHHVNHPILQSPPPAGGKTDERPS